MNKNEINSMHTQNINNMNNHIKTKIINSIDTHSIQNINNNKKENTHMNLNKSNDNPNIPNHSSYESVEKKEINLSSFKSPRSNFRSASPMNTNINKRIHFSDIKEKYI